MDSNFNDGTTLQEVLFLHWILEFHTAPEGIQNICFFPQKRGQKRAQESKMTGWGEDKDSKSEAEIQRYKLLLFF